MDRNDIELLKDMTDSYPPSQPYYIIWWSFLLLAAAISFLVKSIVPLAMILPLGMFVKRDGLTGVKRYLDQDEVLDKRWLYVDMIVQSCEEDRNAFWTVLMTEKHVSELSGLGLGHMKMIRAVEKAYMSHQMKLNMNDPIVLIRGKKGYIPGSKVKMLVKKRWLSKMGKGMVFRVGKAGRRYGVSRSAYLLENFDVLLKTVDEECLQLDDPLQNGMIILEEELGTQTEKIGRSEMFSQYQRRYTNRIKTSFGSIMIGIILIAMSTYTNVPMVTIVTFITVLIVSIIPVCNTLSPNTLLNNCTSESNGNSSVLVGKVHWHGEEFLFEDQDHMLQLQVKPNKRSQSPQEPFYPRQGVLLLENHMLLSVFIDKVELKNGKNCFLIWI